MTVLESMQAIPAAEAIDRFQLQRHLPRYEADDDRRRARGSVRVHEGNLTLEGDLALDWGEAWKGIEGLVVTGDLTVSGRILNRSGDGGPFLVVLGQLVAAHVVAGGSDLWIAGGATVDGLILGHYNHGTLKIGGETKAGLVIGDDHSMELRTSSPFWDDHTMPIGMPLGEYLHADVSVERITEGLLVPCERADVDDLVSRVVEGRPVLRAADDTRPRRSVAEWRELIPGIPDLIRYAPVEAMDEAMCRELVAERGWLLEHVPLQFRSQEVCSAALASDEDAFRYLPDPLKTPERCLAAVQHRGWNLEHVPTSLRTKELCELAIDNDSLFYAIRAVPEPLLSEDLCLRAVKKNVANLREMPESSRSLEVCAAAVALDPWAAKFVPGALRAEVLAKAGRTEEELQQAESPRPAASRVTSESMDALAEKIRLSRPSMFKFIVRTMFGAMSDGDGPWPSGVVGWFARRPMLILLLRGVVSMLLLGVHVWLTVVAWRAGGAIAGIATFLLVYVSELYWAWRIATTTGLDALAVLAVASVALFWSTQWLLARTSRVWKAREDPEA